MESNYTSLGLSMRLVCAGCELESKYWYIKDKGDIFLAESSVVVDLLNPKLGFEKVCNAYDLLNDICCKYADKFFSTEDVCWRCGKSYKEWYEEIGYNYCDACRRCEHNKKRWEFVSKHILELMQQGKKTDAELYIWQNTLFNNNSTGDKNV